MSIPPRQSGSVNVQRQPSSHFELEQHEGTTLQYYIEELKSMRDEINWRAKAAYTGSIIFISAITIMGISLFEKDNQFLATTGANPKLFVEALMVALLAASAWVGVQNANHLIVKRIELYTLEILKLIQRRTNHVHFAWLAYLYGEKYFKSNRENDIARLLNSSIGFFMYLLPSVAIMFAWVYLLSRPECRHTYLFFFIFISFFALAAVSSTVLFYYYVLKLHSSFGDFYKSYMRPYLDAGGFVTKPIDEAEVSASPDMAI